MEPLNEASRFIGCSTTSMSTSTAATRDPKLHTLNITKLTILLAISLMSINLHSIVDCSSIQLQETTKQKQQATNSINDNILLSKSIPLQSIDESVTNKTTNNGTQIDITEKNSNKSINIQQGPGLEQWFDFAFEEYDLMDYLQNLSARYKNFNQQQSAAQSPGEELTAQPIGESLLEAKQNIVEEVKRLVIAQTTQQSPETSTIKPKKEPAKPMPTTEAELATSLASEPLAFDQEMGESSWQYGIFDRFTRPRSTTTTPDPKFTFDPHAKIDMNQFNSEECGLRTYDQFGDDQLLGDRHLLGGVNGNDAIGYPPSPIQGGSVSTIQQEDSVQDQGAIKELNNRRQRPSNFLSMSNNNGPISIADLTRWQQLEVIYNNLNKQQEQLYQSSPSMSAGVSEQHNKQQIANWPNKDEKENYDAYKSQLLDQQAAGQTNRATSVNSNYNYQQNQKNEDEFNLLARRNWLQQQLGNTLQMFASINSTGFETFLTNVSLSSNDGRPSSAVSRENMMKKFGNLRAAKSSNPLVVSLDELQRRQASPSESRSIDGNGFIAKDSINELKPRQDELKLEPRVIGGNDARLGDSPWSVSLQALVSRPGTGQVEYRHYCGGTIISEHYILTAAHCLDFMVGRESRLFVVIGDLNWRMSTASQYGRRFGIDKLIIHSGYKNTAFGHDVGLIRTKTPMRPLKVNGRYIINSVCLPEKGVEHSGEAELVGWGLFSNRNEMADALQIAEVPILPRPLCVDLYRRRTGLIQWLIGIELITEKQVCAGTFGRGICQGDSGSALVFNEKRQPGSSGSLGTNQLGSPLLKRHTTDDTRATIIGVVAFGGIRRCSYQSLPGVYMQTSKYMDWILPRIQA